MRFIIVLFMAVLCCMLSSCSYARAIVPFSLYAIADTEIINHKTDGIINEWPSSKFESDIATDIKYAIDNDGNNLYIVLNVPNQGIQMKLMRLGMKLFIDLKGKRKEGRGISFPVKDEAALANDNNFSKAAGIQTDDDIEKTNRPEKSIDKKAMRSTMALHLTYMNVFGFDGSEAHDQGLQMPGSINVAFAWDTADAMHIEYTIPLKMLENSSALNQKEISIGWRINGIYPADQSMQRSGNPRGRRRGKSAYGGSSQPGFGESNHVTRETLIREQNIWTRYIVNSPAETKTL
ncbi:MAG: hypothetical protein WDO19_21385 [Bacteroidota bacterium]